tara:strand:- start:104 stop:268 length:165 start_codon:yes stop_codon:yes gene_type:complete
MVARLTEFAKSDDCSERAYAELKLMGDDAREATLGLERLMEAIAEEDDRHDSRN